MDFEIPKDEHIKWYLYERYRGLMANDNDHSAIWETTHGESYKPSKMLFGETISPVFEEYKGGFVLWVKSPFTEKILQINQDGKFRSYEE